MKANQRAQAQVQRLEQRCIKYLLVIADAVASHEPADVIDRWSALARQHGVKETQVDAAIRVGLDKRQSNRSLH